jgi:hypothetical protein
MAVSSLSWRHAQKASGFVMATGYRFVDLNHAYYIDDERVPSVTQTLQAEGIIDFSMVPQPIMLEARDRGSAVHRACEYFNQNDLDVPYFIATFPEYAPYLQAWIRFREESGAEIQVCEHRVYSRKHRYGGTLDCLGHWNGKGCLIDLKTGDPRDVGAQWQTAAYLGALTEMAAAGEAPALPPQPIVRYAVQLRKDATYRVETYADPRDHAEFLTLLRAFHIRLRHRGAWIEIAA